MSNEPTQAVQRAAVERLAKALAQHARKTGVRDLRDHCICGWSSEKSHGAHLAHASEAALAAALDVEEIALALFEVDYERGLNDVPWHEEQDWFLERYRKRARALRAAILGEES